MPSRMIEWLQTLSGEDKIDVSFYSDKNDSGDMPYASCYPGRNSYTVNLTALEEYKDDEAAIMYLAGHEVGHHLDPNFIVGGLSRMTFSSIILFAISFAVLFNASLLGAVVLLSQVGWIGVAFLSGILMVNIRYDIEEKTAEEFVYKYLSSGIALHGNLLLASLSKKDDKRRCKEKNEEFKIGELFGCDAYLEAINRCLIEIDGDLTNVIE